MCLQVACVVRMKSAMDVYMTRALCDGKLVFTLLAQAELGCDAPCVWVYVQLSRFIIPRTLRAYLSLIVLQLLMRYPVTFSSDAKGASNNMTLIGVGEESLDWLLRYEDMNTSDLTYESSSYPHPQLGTRIKRMLSGKTWFLT